MLQINANPNQDAIIIESHHMKKTIIQSLNFNDIYKFVEPIVNSTSSYNYYSVVAISNGLVLMVAKSMAQMVNRNHCNFIQFLVYNPITKEYIKLPQLPTPIHILVECNFFEHDLQSNTYKIFVVSKNEVYIYSSSSHFWQTFNDSFSNFKSNFQYGT